MNPLQIKKQDYTLKQKELLDYLKTLQNDDGSYKSFDAAQETELKRREDEIKVLKSEIERMERLDDLAKSAQDELKAYTTVQRQIPQPGEGEGKPGSTKAFTVPARARISSVKSFKAIPGGLSAEEQAFRFGHWFCGGVFNRTKSVKWCKEHGVDLLFMDDGDNEDFSVKNLRESLNTSAGALIPDEFNPAIIDLREKRGVFRQNIAPTPMMRDTKSQPRRTGGTTAYWPSEGGTITASDVSFNRVNLVAKKLACLTIMSSEVSEDTVIDIGDWVAKEIAYSFADAEDKAAFLGDGTSTYGHVVGLTYAFLNLTETIANIAGLFVGSGNAYSELTLNDFINTAALLPEYADDETAKWFMHKSFYYAVCVRVALAAGGVYAEEVKNGMRNPTFLGYPVVYTQVMPKSEANSQICAFLGDLNRAITLGDRRQMTLAVSDQFKFDSDEIAVRGTERLDINAHDVGNASSTPSLRVPGPIVGLITADS